MGIGGVGGGGGGDDPRSRLESIFHGSQLHQSTPRTPPHETGQGARQTGRDLAKNSPVEDMITQLNSTLEKLDIANTGEFVTDTTGGFKFKVNQAYLEEKGFLVVQNDLLELNKEIQENPSLNENILNYRVEIDPTRNIVKFKPSADFKYAPEIVNIRNIPKEHSPTEGIFEDYPINTLIPVLVGPPPIDYLKRQDGEKTSMFSGIEENAFKALEKATKQDDLYKTDFHLAHALNIAMLPNAKWVIIDDNRAIDTLGFPTAKFKELLSPELVISNKDMWNLKSGENHTQPFYDTPLTPPSIRKLLPKLAIQVRQQQGPNAAEPRFMATESKTALAPQLGPHIDAASFHHLLQYFNQYPLLQKANKIDPAMPQAHKGFLCNTSGSSIGPISPSQS
ncbi:MAG: hypothetical protein ACKO3R_01900 [bacterium]